MKKATILFTFTVVSLTGFSQTGLDTLKVQVEAQGKSMEGISKTVNTIKPKVDTLAAYVTAQKEKSDKAAKDCAGCDISFIGWLLIFSPIWIFLIALLVIRKKLKDFSLKDALTESELPKKTIPNPEYTIANINALATNAAINGMLPTLLPATIEVTSTDEPLKSSSRYIAFITSALTWIIILCLTCFFIYQYMKKGEAPDLSGLSSVLLALGIGVVPYAFNKISTAVK
jgi:hypothetical protein